MEKSSTDQIMDTQIEGICQQKFQLYCVVKAGQLPHQGKWHPRPNSTEISSYDGRNQHNGYHCFLRGED